METNAEQMLNKCSSNLYLNVSQSSLFFFFPHCPPRFISFSSFFRACCGVGLWAEFSWYSSLNSAVSSARDAYGVVEGIQSAVSGGKATREERKLCRLTLILVLCVLLIWWLYLKTSSAWHLLLLMMYKCL